MIVAVTSFDQVLIAPNRDDLRRTLLAAVPPNSTKPSSLTPFERTNPESFLDRWQREPEGFQQWNGGPERPHRGQECSAVALAWWTDPIGRKHCRVVATRHLLAEQSENFLSPTDRARPALWLVYPDHVSLRHRSGVRSLWVCCGCGVSGSPDAVGWMGTSCAACHDRREEGTPSGQESAARTLDAGRIPSALAFGPKGQTLATADRNGTIRLWDLGTGRHEDVATGLAGGLPYLAFAPRGRSLVLGMAGSGVVRRDLGTRRNHPLGALDVCGVAFSANGRRLALAMSDRVELLDTPMWQSGRVIHGHVRRITCAALSPDGRIVATGSEDRTAILWDVEWGRERTTLRGSWGSVRGLAFAPDGRVLAVAVNPLSLTRAAEEQSRVLLWDERTNQITTTLSLPAPAWGMTFSSDGRFLILLMEFSRRILVWDVAAGRECEALEWHTDSVTCAGFSPDGEWLATGADDGLVRLWPWRQVSGAAAGWPTSGARRSGPL